MSIIHVFLYDTAFLNSSSIINPVRKTGGMCIPSQTSLTYFTTPEEISDPRNSRNNNLNFNFTTKSRIIIDQLYFSPFLNDFVNVWSLTEQQNLFAIIDQLCFSYNQNATPDQIELSLSLWTQYKQSSFVLSNTKTSTPVYGNNVTQTITCPDYVTFIFVISNGTQYELRIWLNNTIFLQNYPLSNISVVVPPLPLSDLYTIDISTTTDNVIHTASISSVNNQQILQNYIQSGEYSGYITQPVTMVNGSGITAIVDFNILYNGSIPGPISIRTAIRNLLLAAITGSTNSAGIGTIQGWTALFPSIFITQSYYLIPLWGATTSLINSIIYPGIIPFQQVLSDVEHVLYDISSGYISSNLNIIMSTYDDVFVAAIPDSNNSNLRMSLLNEHPTYQNVPTTSTKFSTQAQSTQLFSSLLGAALSVAYGNTNNNSQLTLTTTPNDMRQYVSFSVLDVEYYILTKASYMNLVGNT